MSGIERQIADLSPEQRELLALLLEREASAAPPLSSTQQRLVTTTQPAVGTALGNVPFAFRIVGSLHVQALNASLNEIVRRHDVLRTTFREPDGRPTPAIAPSAEVSLPVMDLRPLAAGERETEALRRVHAEARQPFDLAQAPLLRGQVIRLTDAEWVLVLVTHHLATDGWGVRLLLQELGELYRSFLTDAPARLPTLPTQYAEYARWEQQWLHGSAANPQLEYWRARLAGCRAPHLPLDGPRPSRPSWTSATERFELSPQLSDALRGLSRQEGVTLYTLLLAAFQTLLQRYSGETDILVGTTISRRHRSEWEALIGNFGNNLLLRTDFSGDPTFQELLHRVSEVVLGAFAHPDIPLEMLIARAQQEGQASPVPPFQVMFILRDTTLAQNLDLPGSAVRPVPAETGAGALDLTLDITDGDAALIGHLEYKTELFAATSAARIVSEYRDVLDRIAVNPSQRLSGFPILQGVGRQAQGVGEAAARPPRGSSAAAAHAPVTPTELLIASLWQQALGIKTLSVHDNFFDLGGHSLLGTIVIDRIERGTGHRLTLLDLSLQNLAQLAQRCDRGAGGDQPTSGITRRLLRLVRGAEEHK